MRLAKWQEKTIKEAQEYAELFIKNKYGADVKGVYTLQPSNTCRFARYTHGTGVIRLNLRQTDVFLYEKKSLGEYKSEFNCVGYKISYTSQLIHELTHLIQDLSGTCFSEVEATKNEIEYLKSINLLN